MSLLKRLFTWGKSEANAALDQMEDPVKMAEQGIRDLKKDLSNSLESLAKVKAQVIRVQKDNQRQRDTATDYEQKAMMLLSRVQDGAITPEEGDRLASEALKKRDAAIERVGTLTQEAEKLNAMTGQLENNVQALKQQISSWENEVATLKARAQVGQATRKLNEQLAQVDSSGTIAMLERMRDKVTEEEALAEAYGEMAQVERSVDMDIEKALAGSSPAQSDALAQLKARMGAAEPIALPNKTNS
ncbi:PspA/IM30 family protein [Terasakiella sp. A23]|uniref:PspA/IM30 family protein n=1 Tax=Terasakiella sp. FCG-A23 TaxID=3080561 RepID=UPI00295580AA|nr:PspA/IM30 family protein [Terasakiella sp. A23]MDV7339912.1 PspA/IM30 family protein [Terasakiella sp. A23]